MATDNPSAFALVRAQRGKVLAVFISPRSTPSREAFDRALARVIEKSGARLVVLAGFMRILSPWFVRRFRGRILNIHPALLPAFGGAGMHGLRVHAAVIASGARVSGATVHFVDEQFDHGPIIAQWPVPVWPNDSPADLAARVMDVEHLLYPRVVHALAAGRIRLDADGKVHGWNANPVAPHFSYGTDLDDVRR